MSLTTFHVQRFSLQDGPGIRTTVFLKGCGLRCLWCHNPESLSGKKELLYYKEKCTRCGRCVQICPQGVHSFSPEGEHVVYAEKCIGCGHCVHDCLAHALEVAGEEREADELFRLIVRDQPFYETTGGGVTFSGGEPLLQAEALAPLMLRCKEAGIHTAVETAGFVPWESIAKVLPHTDLWLFDLKAVTATLFHQGCGQDNQQILTNLRQLAAGGDVRMWIRIPLIPGFNTAAQELQRMADFIASLGPVVEKTDILPYHDIGKTKYAALQKEYPWERDELVSDAAMKTARCILLGEGK